MTERTKPEDLRVQRSRALLLQALVSLLNEKPFDEIRVTDLCARAGVHRSTFYAHFTDKLHLLTYGIRELMDILIEAPSQESGHFQHAMYRVFKYFKLHQQEYTLLFLNPQNAAAKDLFLKEFGRCLEQTLRQHHPQGGGEDLRARSLFFTGGLFMVMAWWLEHGAQPAPREMARRFAGMVSPGFTLLPRSLPDAWGGSAG